MKNIQKRWERLNKTENFIKYWSNIVLDDSNISRLIGNSEGVMVGYKSGIQGSTLERERIVSQSKRNISQC